MSILLFLMRLILGGIFIYPGFSKLIVPAANFAAVIQGYQFINPPLTDYLAFVLPWLELIFGTFLWTGFMIRLSASVISVLTLTFVALLTRSIILKLPLTECGCFGAGITLEPKQALILDAGLFLMAICIRLWPPKLFSLDMRLLK